jgi:hypothetical protein
MKKEKAVKVIVREAVSSGLWSAPAGFETAAWDFCILRVFRESVWKLGLLGRSTGSNLKKI